MASGNREGTALGTQDLANVALGAITMTATFLVGKIVVENIIQSRKEHFDKKGQPPAAVKAKETTMDGIVKLLGMGLSLWQMQKQLPVVIAEAQKMMR